MKIRIAVHGRYHAFDLARELHRLGMLEAVHTTYPAFVARRWLAPDIRILGEPLLELRRRFAQRILGSNAQDAPIAEAFGRAVAGRIGSSNADILVGWSGATLEAVAPAQAHGMKVVIERGSTHIDHQTRVLRDAFAKCGIVAPPTGPRLIERERAEYAAADAIFVPSALAARTFVDAGVPTGKVFVNPLEVDTSRFAPPAERPARDRPRVLFAGLIGIRKGVPDLLAASAALNGSIALVLAGDRSPEFADLPTLPMTGVTFAGGLSGEAMASAYRDADIFCLPSLEEGFGMTVLEAMASGLPVVVSDQVGAADAVTDGVTGFIVPAGNPDALAARLEQLATDRDLRTEMGRAARTAMQGRRGWADTAARAVATYRTLLD